MTEARATHADDPHVAEALRLAPPDAPPLRSDGRLMYHNVVVGLAAVQGERARLDAAGVPVPWAQLAALPSIAQSFCRAADRFDGLPLGDKTAPVWREFWTVRGKLLRAADALVDDGAVSADRVEAVRHATRRKDRAGDLHKLVMLFREHEGAIAGRTAITAADLARAETLSESVLTSVRPRGARKAAESPARAEARRTRDALGWLLATRHAALVAAAGWLWGRALGQHVPGLTSFRGARRATPVTETPASDAHAPAAPLAKTG